MDKSWIDARRDRIVEFLASENVPVGATTIAVSEACSRRTILADLRVLEDAKRIERVGRSAWTVS